MNDSPIETYLKTSDSKSLNVLFWLLKHRDAENILTITLDYVASECHVTKVTVNRIFQKLYDKGFLEKIRNGQYKLHKV